MLGSRLDVASSPHPGIKQTQWEHALRGVLSKHLVVFQNILSQKYFITQRCFIKTLSRFSKYFVPKIFYHLEVFYQNTQSFFKIFCSKNILSLRSVLSKHLVVFQNILSQKYFITQKYFSREYFLWECINTVLVVILYVPVNNYRVTTCWFGVLTTCWFGVLWFGEFGQSRVRGGLKPVQ